MWRMANAYTLLDIAGLNLSLAVKIPFPALQLRNTPTLMAMLTVFSFLLPLSLHGTDSARPLLGQPPEIDVPTNPVKIISIKI
jgi:hypothetical protein